MPSEEFTSSLIKAVLQALAQPAEVQIGLLPNGIPVGEEMALMWEQAYAPYIEKQPCTDAQHSALAAVEAQLAVMSEADSEDLWFEESALVDDQRWRHTRELAAIALAELGWPEGPPEFRGFTYVFPQN